MPTPTLITQAADDAISSAKGAPELVAKLQTADPELAQQIEGKALFASRTPAGVFLATAIAYVSTKYGLGWDPAFVAMVSGGVLLVAAYALRAITTSPITGWFKKSPVVVVPSK